jgi:hypothetical protein
MPEEPDVNINAFYGGSPWKGVSCVDYFWPFTASNQDFEVRRAIGQLVYGLRYLKGPNISALRSGGDVDLSDVLQVVKAADSIHRAATGALNEAVAEAIARGATWKQVGDSLGILRTAAQKRFGKGVSARRQLEIRDEGAMCATVFANWLQEIPASTYGIDDEDFETTPPEVWVDHAIRKFVETCARIHDYFASQESAKNTATDDFAVVYALYQRLGDCFRVLMLRQSFDAFEEYARKASDGRPPWIDENASICYLRATVRISIAFRHFTQLWDAIGDEDEREAAIHMAYVLANTSEAERIFARPEITNVLACIEQEIARSGHTVYGIGTAADVPADTDGRQMAIMHAIWKNDKRRLAELAGVDEIVDDLSLDEMLNNIDGDDPTELAPG